MSRARPAGYVVRRWAGLWSLAAQVAPVLVVGVVLAVLQGRWVVNLVTLGVVLCLAVPGVDRATVVLRVDGAGIAWNPRASGRVLLSGRATQALPWSSVAAVTAVDGDRLQVRLVEHAPLPPWLRGHVLVDGEPTVVQWSVPGLSGPRIETVASAFVQKV